MCPLRQFQSTGTGRAKGISRECAGCQSRRRSGTPFCRATITMTKFLHISDIHLGIKRYGLEERTKDFFRAWNTCLQNYAIDEGVDFVLIGGDLFDRRQIDPQAANHAIYALERLRAAGIPAFAIEGNHDQRETGSDFSWLRSFSQWRFLRLLEPLHVDGGIE